jgi:hypothetical protein
MLQLELIGAGSAQLSWTDGEQSFFHVVSKANGFICDLIHGCLDLDRWRGQVVVDASSDREQIEFIWMDVFEDQLSYQWIERLGERGHFRRLAYGRVDVLDFKELVYASLTDLLVSFGKKGYEELAMTSFPQSRYGRLAKQLGRPSDLPEDGDVGNEEVGALEEADWKWESDDGEEHSVSLPPDQGALVVRPEFLKLAQLISDKDEHRPKSK